VNSEQGKALDRKLTTPPWDCEEDGHVWQYLGTDPDGCSYFRCRRCGKETEE